MKPQSVSKTSAGDGNRADCASEPGANKPQEPSYTVCSHTQDSCYLQLPEVVGSKGSLFPAIRVSIENQQAPFLVCTHYYQDVSLFSADGGLTCCVHHARPLGQGGEEDATSAQKSSRPERQDASVKKSCG